MKLEIDVAALFAKLDPKYKWIGTNCHGALFAFENKPVRTIGGRGWCLTGVWDTIAIEPQLFERPVPSAWKRVEDCNLDRLVNVLYKWSDTGFCGVINAENLRAMASSERARHKGLTWCEIPK